MIVLGIETSSRWSGVALSGEDGPLGEFHLHEGGRTEHIHLLMVRLLEAAGLTPRSIGGVAVSLGPGSFTGLRIGLGAAKGISLATGNPVVGVPLVPLLAEAVLPWEGETAVWIDAGRGEVFGALYRRGEEVEAGRTAPPEDHLRRLAAGETVFVGTGALRYREKVEGALGGRARYLERRRSLPDASRVARWGRELLLSGAADGIDDLEPLYIREVDARPLRG